MTSAESETVLEVRGLRAVRGGAVVIENGCFRIAKGEYAGIVGPNGGGKTTLLQTILGYHPRTEGEIFLFGQPADRFKDWQRIAYTPQDAIHFDEQFPLTVRELVSLGRVRRSNLLRRLNGKDWEKVDETMELMGVSEISERRIGQLSGGQKQRAFVAKALALDPELLILDEPTSGLDASGQESFYKVLGNINKERGTTIVVVSHDLAAVFCRMTQVICVNKYIHQTGDLNVAERLLRGAYGNHFRFVMHGDCECCCVPEDV
ncbi:MAG: metal ABC transporter ATP-binding protein [Candidatus Methanoplasma sp.]|jgi:zinc transport system ATP-binding protein|nr:metal ABC transporter ATP-binding protein [Candidatus Methanoplasma sp.]